MTDEQACPAIGWDENDMKMIARGDEASPWRCEKGAGS